MYIYNIYIFTSGFPNGILFFCLGTPYSISLLLQSSAYALASISVVDGTGDLNRT